MFVTKIQFFILFRMLFWRKNSNISKKKTYVKIEFCTKIRLLEKCDSMSKLQNENFLITSIKKQTLVGEVQNFGKSYTVV